MIFDMRDYQANHITKQNILQENNSYEAKMKIHLGEKFLIHL